jgi:5-formyltetrahydrofolate cyclo-ligase
MNDTAEPEPEPPAAAKAALRARLRRLRREAHARDPDAGDALAARFPLKLLTRFGPVVAGYWPIGSEIDPRPLMALLRREGAQLTLPWVEADDTLSFRALPADIALDEGSHALALALEDAPRLTPTLILLPLVGFDAHGTRLGQGKAHYDRALAALRREGRAFACGLAFDAQEADRLPREPHDQPLDWLVTPTRNLPLMLTRASAPDTPQGSGGK